jgi:hypothetical protein
MHHRRAKSLAYDLDNLHHHSIELGFEAARSSADRLAVTLLPGVVLEFANLVDESDTLIGFHGTPWHTHDSLMLMVGRDSYIKLSEFELLSALRTGDAVVVEQYFEAELSDRWIAHKLEPFDIKYIEPGEEIRIHRLC